MKNKPRRYLELSALKGRIKEEKSSYRALAKKIGITTNTSSDKVNGYAAMSCPELAQIAEALKIEPIEIAHFFTPDY